MTSTPTRHDMLSARLEQRRIISDDEGRTWIVREVPNGYDRRGGTSLVFQCDALTRRTRIFPPTWFELPDDQLYELSLWL